MNFKNFQYKEGLTVLAVMFCMLIPANFAVADEPIVLTAEPTTTTPTTSVSPSPQPVSTPMPQPPGSDPNGFTSPALAPASTDEEPANAENPENAPSPEPSDDDYDPTDALDPSDPSPCPEGNLGCGHYEVQCPENDPGCGNVVWVANDYPAEPESSDDPATDATDPANGGPSPVFYDETNGKDDTFLKVDFVTE